MLYNDSITQDNLNLSFAWACECGYYDVAFWLYSKGANIHALNNHAFKLSCIHDYIAICQWLYSIDKTIIECIDITSYNLITGCKSENVMLWLQSVKN